MPAFLQSESFVALVHELQVQPNKAARLPLLAPARSFIEMLEAATESLPFALCVVDVQIAGLPMVYVNAAFEALTAYSRSEALGQRSSAASPLKSLVNVLHARLVQRTQHAEHC